MSFVLRCTGCVSKPHRDLSSHVNLLPLAPRSGCEIATSSPKQPNTPQHAFTLSSAWRRSPAPGTRSSKSWLLSFSSGFLVEPLWASPPPEQQLHVTLPTGRAAKFLLQPPRSVVWGMSPPSRTQPYKLEARCARFEAPGIPPWQSCNYVTKWAAFE